MKFTISRLLLFSILVQLGSGREERNSKSVVTGIQLPHGNKPIPVDKRIDATLVGAVPSIIDGFITGQLTTVLIPIIIKLFIFPFLAIIKAVSKTIIFIGVFAYLVSAGVPLMFTAAGVSIARSTGRSFFGKPFILAIIDGMNAFFAKILTFVRMDHIECKEYLACQAGQFLGMSYPKVASFFNETRLADVFDHDRVMHTLINSMNSRRCVSSCDLVERIQKYVELDVRVAFSPEVLTTPPPPEVVSLQTSSPPPPPPEDYNAYYWARYASWFMG